jgi:hypothetical protein
VKTFIAPAIVLVVAIVGAHPFCNLAFHCGCDLLALAARCNIHHAVPPHCPWCAHPLYFALSLLFALAISGFALWLTRQRPFLLHLFCGLLALFCGASGAAALTAHIRP